MSFESHQEFGQYADLEPIQDGIRFYAPKAQILWTHLDEHGAKSSRPMSAD